MLYIDSNVFLYPIVYVSEFIVEAKKAKDFLSKLLKEMLKLTRQQLLGTRLPGLSASFLVSNRVQKRAGSFWLSQT